jgi:cysteine desulfurase
MTIIAIFELKSMADISMKLISYVFLGFTFLGIKAYADPIYLDYQATTPVDPRVLEEMLPYFTKEFGNPHSTIHNYGMRSHEAVEKARRQIAKVINADPQEIIFTSGATEANNLAILGACRTLKSQGKSEVINVATEHKSVLEPLEVLKKEGFKIIIIPVQKNGIINLHQLRKVFTSKGTVNLLRPRK